MAYRDPYAEQYARSQPYNDGPEFNPYGGQHQPHQSYDQGGYDDPYYRDAGPAAGGYRDDPQMRSTEETAYASTTLANKEASDFVNGSGEKSKKDLREYRYSSRGALWTQGGRGRCIGRFCCCTIMITIFLLISIVLSLLLWVRPPNITINNVSAGTGNQVSLQSSELDINLSVDIAVENPNYFAVDFKKIEAQIFYPINNTAIGGGQQNDITFHANSQTNFTFPFEITYKKSLDPSDKILVDIATKCGFIGGSKSQIKVDYKISLGIRVLFITISPVVSNSISFDCPLSESEIQSLGPGLLGGS